MADKVTQEEVNAAWQAYQAAEREANRLRVEWEKLDQLFDEQGGNA